MKIFATQLYGVFQKIIEREEEALEDGSRLAAQGPAGTGRLLLYATSSMKGNAFNLSNHPDAPAKTLQVQELKDITPEPTDRAIILAEKKEAEDLQIITRHLQSAEVPMVVIAPFSEEDGGITLDPTDVWVQTHVKGGLVPDEKGKRIGSPSSLSTLFTGQLLFLHIKELLDELD
ncbi:DUF2529 family protein [Alteribacillus sp. JSM 102045]|uniref:DUF2529 family protein n=1 Tax=Alteribacillus sp. JSM 102045 TaxID=1562101 RepID=UPI0035BF8279